MVGFNGYSKYIESYPKKGRTFTPIKLNCIPIKLNFTPKNIDGDVKLHRLKKRFDPYKMCIFPQKYQYFIIRELKNRF